MHGKAHCETAPLSAIEPPGHQPCFQQLGGHTTGARGFCEGGTWCVDSGNVGGGLVSGATCLPGGGGLAPSVCCSCLSGTLDLGGDALLLVGLALTLRVRISVARPL